MSKDKKSNKTKKKSKKKSSLTKPAELKVVTYFDKKDKDFLSDFIKKEIYLDGELVQTYQDDYHDGGYFKTEGFLQACLLLIVRGVIFSTENRNLNE